jgi:two-component system phosphate regulon sensor histidine kinase PhoR
VRTLLRGLAGELNPRQEELLGRVEIRLDGLLTLVNDLLTLAASNSLQAERSQAPVNVNSVLQRVLQHFADEAANKQIALKYAAPDQDATVQATDDGLETVLSNLVGNAIKYTPSGGAVQVELDVKENRAMLRIADTGIGIREEDLPRIGQEFFRGANARGNNIQGTGLGLSIARELLQRFDAHMDIKSRDGQGTTVELDLPLCKPAAEPKH